MNIGAVLAILLAISLAGNGALLRVYMAQRDAATAAVKDRDAARGAASTCSDATEALAEQAAKRAKESKLAIAAAAAAAASATARADEILATAATVPGDDCRSATDRAHAWLQSRKGTP